MLHRYITFIHVITNNSRARACAGGSIRFFPAFATLFFLLTSFLPALGSSTGEHSARLGAIPSKVVINLQSVSKRKLSNGMTVLVCEDHSAPVASVNIWVKTGYFNEPDNISGISHLLEHMFFKGTVRRPVGRIQEEVKSVGGYWNAGTIYDHTNYYITVPSSEITRALEIESDALLNSVFDPAELKKEQEVIVQEILRKYDNPSAMAWESMMALAYKTHYLGRWRMGKPEQIRAINRETLFEYYWNTYRPENIVLVIAGDVETRQVMTEVRRLFGSMPKSKLKKTVPPPESPQTSLRFNRLTADVMQAQLIIGFHAPAALAEDEQAMQALSQLLGDGRSSRLYRELKERRNIVNTISASYYSLPGIGTIYIQADLDPANLQAAQEAVFAEIEKIKHHPPTAAELDKIKTSMEFSFISAMEDVSEQAATLAYYESLGDYKLLNDYLERLRAVTPANVQHTTAKYLGIEKASIVEYIPEKVAAPERNVEIVRRYIERATTNVSAADAADVAPKTADNEPVYNSRQNKPIATPVLRRLSNGIEIFIQERPRLPIVSIGVFFPGGRLIETKQTAGLARLMMRTTIKGTKNRTAEQIQNEIESLGTSIAVGAGPDYSSFSLNVLTRNMRPALDILADVITQPTFPSDEIDKERETQLSQIKRGQDNMSSYPIELARKAAFGDHPYGLPPNGFEDNLPQITRADITDAYNTMLNTPGALITIVGDIDAEAATGLLESKFGGIKNTNTSATPTPATASAPNFASAEIIVERKRAQTAQAFAFPAPCAITENLPALNILRNIASGMGGRLYNEVREKNNLAYTVAAYLELNRYGGLLINYAATSPENEIRAREMMLSEWKKMLSGNITPEEFETARRYTMGIYQIGLQGNSSIRDQQAHNMLMGRGVGFLDKYISLVRDTTLDDVKAAAATFDASAGLALGVVRATDADVNKK